MRYNKHLIVASSLYLVFWIFASNYLIHGINPDTISYFSISKKYFDGNFSEAINGYWGALFSWLVLPSFLLKIEPHIFSRILFGVFSIIFFILIERFFIRLELNDKIKALGIYFFILPAVFFSFYRLTPDYLLLILILAYVYITTNENFWKEKRLVILSSVFGALMFLTKSYGLMFFISFQTILLITEFLANKKFNKNVLLNYLMSLLLFAIIISPWIFLLSQKYDRFTMSTSGSINLRIVNPELNLRHPSIESGFVAPSDDYAVSAWDDPDIDKYPQWSPFSSSSYLKYFLINTAKNIFKLFVFILAFAPLISAFIFFLKKKDFQNQALIKILVAGIIYGLGYTTINVENRYIWPSFIFFTIVGLYSLNSYYNRFFLNQKRFIVFSLFVIVSFIPFFTYGINQQLPTTSSYNQAKLIKNKFEIRGNFATTKYWEHGLALAYYLKSKFYGIEKLPINSPELLEKAQKLGINYIFDYSEKPQVVNGLRFIGKIDSISIYKVNE